MFGMGFLRLNKILARHKWKSGEHDEDIEKARKKEQRLLTIGLTVFFGLLLLAIVFGGR